MARIVYSAAAEWPLLSTNRSRSGSSGFGGVVAEHAAEEERDQDVRRAELAADMPQARVVDHLEVAQAHVDGALAQLFSDAGRIRLGRSSTRHPSPCRPARGVRMAIH